MKPKVQRPTNPKKPNLLRILIDARYIPLTGKYDPFINQKIRKRLST